MPNDIKFLREAISDLQAINQTWAIRYRESLELRLKALLAKGEK